MEWLFALCVASLLSIAGVLLRYVPRERRHRREVRALSDRSAALAAKFAAVLSGMPDGIMVLDGNLRLTDWNRQFPDFVGVPGDALRTGMSIDEILRFQAEAGEFGTVNVEDEVSRRVTLWRAGRSLGVIERKRPNGRTLELRRSELPEGGFVTLYTDITARREAENQLRQAQKLEAVGQLSGGIAHDFNNVLQAVAGCANVIQRWPTDTQRVERLARLITESADRGSSITRRLLAFARRDELRAEPVDVSEMLDGLTEILSHTLGAAISVRCEVEGELSVVADKGQLETVLLNLATNGRDAMPDGGVLILKAVAEEIEVGQGDAIGPGLYVRLSVTDTGTGIDPAILPRVTEPFFTTKASGEGTGLGLSMAKGLAEQSNGCFTIASQPGVGTTVNLWLPKIAMVVFPAMPAEEKNKTSLSSACILIVDDDPLVLEALEEHLSDNYTVRSALGGAEALQILEDDDGVDVLVTDLTMPEMDGVQLIQRAQALRRGLPAILLTGYAGAIASLAVGGAVTGAFSLLRKPVTGVQVTEIIESLLIGGGSQLETHRSTSSVHGARRPVVRSAAPGTPPAASA